MKPSRRPTQAVILCGGLGTRLGERTATTPKPLLEVGGAPFLDVLLFEIGRRGFKDVLLLAGFRGDKIVSYAQANVVAERFKLALRVEVETSPAGTGGALKRAEALLDDVFVLMNGDTWFDVNLLDLAPRGEADWLAGLALLRVPDASRYGLVEVAGERIVGLNEKPEGGGSGLVNGGVAVLRRDVLRYATDSCSLERDIYPQLAAHGRLFGREHPGYFIDIGVPETLERAQTEVPAHRARPAAFLDRDGVLNVDTGYVGHFKDWRWVNGARAAIKRLNDLGWYVFVVTNQSGIGRGYYTEDDFWSLHRQVLADLAEAGAHLDDVRFCPFHVEAAHERYRRQSDWRKPEPGMIVDLLEHWPVRIDQSLLIGDQPSDLEAARQAGVAGVLFERGDLSALVGEQLALRSLTA